MTGLTAIDAVFATTRAQNRAAFMPFFTIGFPDYDTSIKVIEALVEAGADAIEIGIPFSDPLADGPTIQHSSQVSLQHGTSVADCIKAVATLRERGVTVPMVLMGYLNPVMAYGVQRYVEDAAAAGVNGFIVPDLPIEEADELIGYCKQHNLSFTPLLAPNSTPERIRLATSKARGYVYLVSVTGVTGARDVLPPDLADYVRRVRGLTTLPLALGFGISRPEQAKTVAKMLDGVVVASALIRLMETDGLEAVKALAASLHAACAH
ncbi:MAG: tryptophan synthase subunit alpha [Anaerolineae bacterium]|nr:tryptophan synthase subunit alpha [Anaerolineae bacterium]